MADDPRMEALARVYAGSREWETLTELQQDACRYQAGQFCRLHDTARAFDVRQVPRQPFVYHDDPQPQPESEVAPNSARTAVDNAPAPTEQSVGAAPEMRQATEEELQAQRASWARGQIAMGDDRQEAEDRRRLAEPSVGADPPPAALVEARKIADTLLAHDVPEMSVRCKIAQMMVGFAARQPRVITDVEVKAAVFKYCDAAKIGGDFNTVSSYMRAALEAAERERARRGG